MKLYNPINKIALSHAPKGPNSLKGQVVGEFPHYRITDGVCSVGDKYSQYANTCSILAMSNGKETYIGHFAPEYKNGNFTQLLDNIVKKFKDATGKISAVVTGGWDYNIGTREARESFELSADIGNVLDKNNAILSMLCGKRNPKFTENLGIFQDKFVISHNRKIGTRQDFLPKNPTPDELEQILYDNYEIMEIAPEHKLLWDKFSKSEIL